MSLSGIHTTSTISDEVASSTAIQVSWTEPDGADELAIRRPMMKLPNAIDSRVMDTLRERRRSMRRQVASVNSSNDGTALPQSVRRTLLIEKRTGQWHACPNFFRRQ